MEDGEELKTGCPFPKPDHRVLWSSILFLASWVEEGGEIRADLKTIFHKTDATSQQEDHAQPSRQDFLKNKDLIHNNSLTALFVIFLP